MLKVEHLHLSINQNAILHDIQFEIKEGEIVSIIGPNGSGKSTILKAISQMIPIDEQVVFLQGEDLYHVRSKERSKRMSVLFQSNEAPHDLTVQQLIEYGRTPHKKWFQTLNIEDEEIIDWAIEQTGLEDFRHRFVSSLSGGEAQRAWIAMSLAQRPKILLLDEPTTYLDIAHQLQLLELIHRVNRDFGMTIVMVLHDLNQASLYSDCVCMIQKGKIVKYGTSEEVMTRELIRQVYHVDCDINAHFKHGRPRIQWIGIAEGD